MGFSNHSVVLVTPPAWKTGRYQARKSYHEVWMGLHMDLSLQIRQRVGEGGKSHPKLSLGLGLVESRKGLGDPGSWRPT